jgi:Protein of unknown function (DUF1524)
MNEQLISYIIVAVLFFSLGFYCYPKWISFVKKTKKLFNFKGKTVRAKRVVKTVPVSNKSLEIKVLGTYPIDGFDFTIIEKPGIDDYDRDTFDPGVTTRVNGEPWSPREVVLMKSSAIKVVLNEKGKIIGGQWLCPYTNAIITDPKYIDIDHIVPLAEAWICGAKNWNDRQKNSYARDIDNLVAVSSIANREKGRCSLENWMPSQKDKQLWYVQRWIYTKRKYNLGMSKEEVRAMVKFAK